MTDDQRRFERIVGRLAELPPPRPEHRRTLWRRMLGVFQDTLRRYEQAGPLRRRWMAMSAPGGALHGRGRRTLAGVVVAIALAAVAIQLSIGLVAAWGGLRHWLRPSAPAAAPVTWPDVLDRLRSVRTIRFRMTLQAADTPPAVYQVAVLRPGRLRVMGSAWTQVIDRQYGKVLTLFPERKACRLDLLIHQSPDQRVPDVMDELASLGALSGRRLGQAGADGTLLFEANKDGRQWTIRVDPHSAEPVEITRLTPADGLVVTLTELIWRPSLDETQFLLAPPEGYLELEQDGWHGDTHSGSP